jgi:hypothetical protein
MPSDLMRDKADMNSLSAQMKELGADLGELKLETAELRASELMLACNFARLRASVIRLDNKLQAFQDHFDSRFDQLCELLQQCTRKTKADIGALDIALA